MPFLDSQQTASAAVGASARPALRPAPKPPYARASQGLPASLRMRASLAAAPVTSSMMCR